MTSRRRRLRGFAMAELLVSLAISGLILGGLLYLQVDYLSLSRRALALGAPYRLGNDLVKQAGAGDRCRLPGAALKMDGDRLLAEQAQGETGVLTLPESQRGKPPAPKAAVFSARQKDGSPRPGWSFAAIDQRDATIAVIALRCDLPEVCDYDPAKGICRGLEKKKTVEAGKT